MTVPDQRSSQPAHGKFRPMDIGLVMWPSFLAAGLASVMFFGAVDPTLLRDAGPRIFAGLDREGGYALGFLFFWAIGILASSLSVYMIRTARPKGKQAIADRARQ